MRNLTSIILVIALFAASLRAEALEYDRADPPNALIFDTVPSKVVRVPNEKIPETCEARYRGGMEKAFQSVWAQCQNIGKQEPSDCQRTLFDRCTKLATDIQKMESNACLKMDDESDAISSVKGVDNQKNSQSSTADLNQRAYVATKKVVLTLQQSLRDLDAQIKSASAQLSATTCAASSSAQAYGAAGAQVTGQLRAARAHVSAMITAKQTAAAQFASNGDMSIQHLDKMASLPPRSSTITGANSRPDTQTVYVGTVVETTTGPIGTSTTTVMATAPATPIQAAAPKAAVVMPPFPLPPPPKKKINWVPILAVGIPAAAILTALVLSKNSRNGVSSQDAGGDSGGGGDNGGGGGGNPGDGGKNPAATNFPGGGDLAAWGIRLDPSFTDREKAGIAAGFAKIPLCYRYKLKGLYMQNKQLPRLSGNRCVAGMFIFGGNTIFFSPACTQNNVPIGVAVHEMFHVIGNRNNNAVHNQFWKVRDAHPNCPVSEYGATNQLEDFAETGRLLYYPDSSVGARYNGACVDAKIAGLHKIMSQCPSAD